MRLKVIDQTITIVDTDLTVVSGTTNIYLAEFDITGTEWSTMAKKAVFKLSGGTAYEIALSSSSVVQIPWEVFTNPDYIQIGIYGTNGTKRYPTLWTKPVWVDNGCVEGQNGQPVPIIVSGNTWDEVVNKPFNTLDQTTLKVVNGQLAVNTTDNAEADNTKPITSAGTYVIVGNIDTLLQTI